jgi:tight adherence protein B
MDQRLLVAVAGLTFVMALGIIMASYWALIVRPEQAARSALSRRLYPRKATAAVRTALLKEAARLSAVPALNRLLSQRKNLVNPLQTLIDQSGLNVTVSVIVLGSACLGLAAFLAMVWFSKLLALGLVLGISAAMIPVIYVRIARNRRIRKFEQSFPESIDLIARSLRAGHAFTAGLAMVADEVPDPVGREFRLLYDQQNYGIPLPAALKAFGNRIPLLDAKFFVTAVLTQREAGGNLSETLDNLSAVIRDRFKIKREVRSKSAHGRLTGWILALLPPTLAVVLYLFNPDYFLTLLRDPLGVRMVIVAAVLQVIGIFVMRRIVDIEY